MYAVVCYHVTKGRKMLSFMSYCRFVGHWFNMQPTEQEHYKNTQCVHCTMYVHVLNIHTATFFRLKHPNFCFLFFTCSLSTKCRRSSLYL